MQYNCHNSRVFAAVSFTLEHSSQPVKYYFHLWGKGRRAGKRGQQACLNSDEVSSIFPLNDADYKKWTKIGHAERHRRSAIPYIQRLLNV